MAYVTHVASAFPPFSLTKEEMIKLFEHPVYNYSDDVLERIGRILKASDISTRPTAVNMKQFYRDLDEGKCSCSIPYPTVNNLFRGSNYNPSITDRAVVWERSVKSLAKAVVKKIQEKGCRMEKVDCVITNTSTGFCLPNLDTWLIQECNLQNVASHFSLDNTGCGGLISCLDAARSHILSGRARNVLIVTVDCCTPHLNTNSQLKMESILPNILFGDGAGGVVVSSIPTKESWKVELPRYALLGFKSRQNIQLSITDKGYLLKLNKNLVGTLQAALKEVWTEWLTDVLGNQNTNEVEWIIHPGGKKILEVFKALDPPLTAEELRYSENVMRTKGNLVSPTLVFVLQEMMNVKDSNKDTACIIGPGPGTEIKMVKLEKYNG